MDLTISNTYRQTKKIHPQLFGLWIGLASITMMFGGFTSAYIVKQASGNWLNFTLPVNFYVSTALIILSSICLQLSYINFKKANEKNYKIFLTLCFILGLGFLISQYDGWSILFERGVDLKINVSGSFLYLIMWIHAAHVLGGIACLVVAMIHAFSLKFVPSEMRRHRFELVLHYWHYLGFLWTFLLFFILFIK
jgi:cytochrome c oxidase subunit 3